MITKKAEQPSAFFVIIVKGRKATGRKAYNTLFSPDVPDNEGMLRHAIPVDSSFLMNPPGRKSLFCFFSLRPPRALCQKQDTSYGLQYSNSRYPFSCFSRFPIS